MDGVRSICHATPRSAAIASQVTAAIVSTPVKCCAVRTPVKPSGIPCSANWIAMSGTSSWTGRSHRTTMARRTEENPASRRTMGRSTRCASCATATMVSAASKNWLQGSRGKLFMDLEYGLLARRRLGVRLIGRGTRLRTEVRMFGASGLQVKTRLLCGSAVKNRAKRWRQSVAFASSQWLPRRESAGPCAAARTGWREGR